MEVINITNQMASMLCEFCDKDGCSIMTQNTKTQEFRFYCCQECCNASILLEKISDGIEYTNREIDALTHIRDFILWTKSDEWKKVLPFVYGWLMFYLALKRRDTRSRLKHLFDLAVRKNQEVFSEVDGNKDFKENHPVLLIALTKYLVKAKQDIAEEFIDLFATTDS